jgi:hypothetical protein
MFEKWVQYLRGLMTAYTPRLEVHNFSKWDNWRLQGAMRDYRGKWEQCEITGANGSNARLPGQMGAMRDYQGKWEQCEITGENGGNARLLGVLRDYRRIWGHCGIIRGKAVVYEVCVFCEIYEDAGGVGCHEAYLSYNPTSHQASTQSTNTIFPTIHPCPPPPSPPCIACV